MAVQSTTERPPVVGLDLGAAEPPVDLDAPFTSDKILEVRSGKMKPMPGLTVLSGIDKSVCDGAVLIGSGGIVDDEHDYTFHGGPDKAVHGCKLNQPTPITEGWATTENMLH